MAIDNRADRRLKRGLEDLSPLFQSAPASVLTPTAPSVLLPRPLFDVEFLTVCVPDQEGDAFLANAYVASLIVPRIRLYATLVSVAPGFNSLPSKSSSDLFPSLELLNPRISRIRLSHQELWSLAQNGGHRKTHAPPPAPLSTSQEGPADPCLIFLEFEPTQFRSLSRVALLLDRVVFFVQSRAESLQEAYRWMKMFWGLNREIEFLLLFRERDSFPSPKEFLFERFSLITSRFMGISPAWLGELALPQKNGRSPLVSGKTGGFNPEPLLSSEGLPRPLSPEKIRFWSELRKILPARSHES